MVSLIHKAYEWVNSVDNQHAPKDIPEGNGNIILGYEIPDEILLQIFQNVNAKYLVKFIPAVCKHWHELSRSWHLWKVRLKKLEINVSKERLERFLSNWNDLEVVAAIQWLCVYNDKKGINHNLIKNPSGAENFTHWKVQHGGDRLVVEVFPVGCDPIPQEANLPTQHCFVSSYGTCKRSQSISLCRDFSLKPFVLDVLRPSLLISEWVSSRFDCGGESMIQTTVIGTNSQQAESGPSSQQSGSGTNSQQESGTTNRLAMGHYSYRSLIGRNPRQSSIGVNDDQSAIIFTLRWKDSDYGRVEWHQMSKRVPYEDLPENMNTIRFKNLSKDTQFWAGHYGAKTAGSSLILDISAD